MAKEEKPADNDKKGGKEAKAKQFSFKELFAWAVASNKKEDTSSQDVMIGIIVFISSIIVAFGIAEFSNQVFNNRIVSIIIGLIFGLITIITNRSLIYTLGSNKGSSTLISIMPFIIILMFQSILISLPIQLKIFEPEVNREITLYKAERINTRYNSAIQFSDVPQISQKIDTLNSSLKILKTRFEQELRGEGGSGRVGYGPITKLLESEIVSTENEIENLKLQQDSLKSNIRKDVEREFQDYNPSILEKYSLIRNLNSNSTIGMASILISMMFLLMNFLPFITKVVISPGMRFKPIREFTDVDKEIKKEKEIASKNEIIQKIKGDTNESYKEEKRVLDNKIKSLQAELTKKNKIENRTFQIYFDSIIASFEREISRSNEKASILLTRGVRASIFGIVFYLSAIIIFQYIFTKNKLETTLPDDFFKA